MQRPTAISRPCLALLALFALLASREGAALGDRAAGETDFNRDVRPILADVCFQCHGPDAGKRKADLRLDTRAGALAGGRGGRVIVPGDPGASELYRRITAADEDERMPPAEADRRLTAEQIDILRRWIGQGAPWQEHWAFVGPRRPAIPRVKQAGWIRNGVDPFILARLESEGLSPSEAADRSTLIRRVTLDLTGLPPTPREVDAFLADRSADAYDRLVDRLLASPRYGERMAASWLDAARYADTNGYQTDAERYMWRWRDWVIDARNRNQPFHEFTIEQLAGDLLPGATLEQRIATGFHRNHRGNGEGGIIAAEYQVEYVLDRVDTTASVWLGLTLKCGQCHDHKYDPISQREFYRVFAFFNNVPEKGRANKYGNSEPLVRAPTRADRESLAEIDRRLDGARARFRAVASRLPELEREWERSLASSPSVAWSLTDGLVARFDLDGNARDGVDPSRKGQFDGGEAAYADGRTGGAAVLDGQRLIDCGDLANFGFHDKFTLGAWIRLDDARGGGIISRMNDTAESTGYNLHVKDGRVQVNLVQRWLDDALRVQTAGPLEAGRWHHVMVTYDGSRLARGVEVYVDGEPRKLEVELDELNQSFSVKEPFRIGSRGTGHRFRGLIDDVRVYDRVLSAEEIGVIRTTDAIGDIAVIPPDERSPDQARKIRACFLEDHAPAEIGRAHREVTRLRRERERLLESFPTVMVMEEMETPRETRVLIRGRYDRPAERVSPGVPAIFPPLPGGVKADRLALARWLVDPAHPLTARVAVNRAWQLFFGTGIVRTVEDFGSQGERPSHPALLDWLATEFIRSGWDVKELHRVLVTSATYRQSSRVPARSLLERDPANRLLARGPRFRLDAEVVRDQALAVSGLLVEKLGGPSVKPYQPPGLWKELSGQEYRQDHGEKLYRRSLYTFWKRTAGPPSMMVFDASPRETCSLRESRTNTPLQALDLMNDVAYVEASRVLARRILKEEGAGPRERLARAFRLATARLPGAGESRILVDGLRHHLRRYRADREAARRLVSAGEYPRDESLDVSELAAYTVMASLILNLDEVVTRE